MDWVAECPLVLRRARDGKLGLFSGLAMVAARWRPRSSARWRGKGRRGPALRGVGPRGRRGAACGGGEAGAGLRPSLAAGGVAHRRRAEKVGRERGGR